MYSRLVLELIHLHCASLSREEATSPAKVLSKKGRAAKKGRADCARIMQNVAILLHMKRRKTLKAPDGKKRFRYARGSDGKKYRVDGKMWYIRWKKLIQAPRPRSRALPTRCLTQPLTAPRGSPSRPYTPPASLAPERGRLPPRPRL